jgi:hypothetical protein
VVVVVVGGGVVVVVVVGGEVVVGNVATSMQLPMYGPGSRVPVSGSATIAAESVIISPSP